MSDPKLPVGTRMCKCSVCGLYFSGDRAFDRHRTGEYPHRKCMTAQEMLRKGWTARGRGPYWQYPDKKTGVGRAPAAGEKT